VATGRPADARLLAVAPAGRSAASYTTIRDMTHYWRSSDANSGTRLPSLGLSHASAGSIPLSTYAISPPSLTPWMEATSAAINFEARRPHRDGHRKYSVPFARWVAPSHS
jgi:hypothetical protein